MTVDLLKQSRLRIQRSNGAVRVDVTQQPWAPMKMSKGKYSVMRIYTLDTGHIYKVHYMFIYTNKQLHVRAAFTGGHDHALQQAIDYNIENTPPASYTSKPGEDFFFQASHHGACGHSSGISDPLKRKAVPVSHAFDSYRRHARERPLHARDGKFKRKLMRQPIEAFIKRRGPPHLSFL